MDEHKKVIFETYIISTEMDVFGKAALDYLSGDFDPTIQVISKSMEDDVIPVPHLFRTYDEMPDCEQVLLDLCRGKVLDVGGGVGSHSLYLQEKGLDVTMIDISEGLCEAAHQRGVKKVICGDFFELDEKIKYDTLIFMMNGIGMGGSFDTLLQLIEKAKNILTPNGVILFDSTDITYCYEDEDGSLLVPLNTEYIGFVEYQISYKNIVDDWFSWTYYDAEQLAKLLPSGAELTILFEDGPAYAGKITFSN